MCTARPRTPGRASAFYCRAGQCTGAGVPGSLTIQSLVFLLHSVARKKPVQCGRTMWGTRQVHLEQEERREGAEPRNLPGTEGGREERDPNTWYPRLYSRSRDELCLSPTLLPLAWWSSVFSAGSKVGLLAVPIPHVLRAGCALARAVFPSLPPSPAAVPSFPITQVVSGLARLLTAAQSSWEHNYPTGMGDRDTL